MAAATALPPNNRPLSTPRLFVHGYLASGRASSADKKALAQDRRALAELAREVLGTDTT